MKKAIDLKIGNKVKIGGEVLTVDNIEISDIGKQGTRKVRMEASKSNGEKVILIRPADYPVNIV